MPHLLTSNDEPDTAAEPAETVAAPADSTPTVLPLRRFGHTSNRVVRARQFRVADP